MSWKDNVCDLVNDIQKVVAVFEVTETRKIPFGKFKVKVLENRHSRFTAFPNVAYKGKSECPDWISGRGKTVEEALNDAIKCLVESIPDTEAICEDDYEWSSPIDF